MTRTTIAMLLAAVATLYGCKSGGWAQRAGTGPAPTTSALAPVASALPPCTTGSAIPSPIVGGVKVFLGNPLAGTAVNREVRHELAASYDIRRAEDARLDLEGQLNTPTTLLRPAPYDVYLGPINAGSSGFLAVLVIKRKNAPFNFLDRGDVHGVIAGGDNVGDALCSNIALRGQPGARQVATFFIDLAKINPASPPRSFLVAVAPSANPDLGIFIDPKVRNGG